MAERVHNFSAGPAALPLPVLETAQRDLLVYPGAGASVMEISHRSKEFTEVIQTAEANFRKLLSIPDNYKVLFLQGGASMQFAMVPMNLLGNGQTADYISTGSWANKAISEAKKFGNPNIAWDNKDEKYVRFPEQADLKLTPGAAYVHVTSNETIQGTEMQAEPETGNVPLVCDASSNFVSKPIDVTKYGLIYAGAQKNIGPAGLAVVIIRDDLLDRVPEGLPSLLDYKLMAENDSLYNTPPSWGVYMVMLVTNWLLNEVGGLEKIAALNQAKAKTLYDVIDGSGGYYRGHAVTEYRSLMNVTFVLQNEDLEKKFVSEATAAGLHGLKGHRSVGGCRASIYNAVPAASVDALAAFMKAFQQTNG